MSKASEFCGHFNWFGARLNRASCHHCAALAKAVAAERKACAALCESIRREHQRAKAWPSDMGGLATECAAAIRARGVPMNAKRILPWHDAPTGPCGCVRAGVPVADMPNGYGGPRESTVACADCGQGWVGTPAEVAKAERAVASWNAFEASGLSEDDYLALSGSQGRLL